MTTVYVPGDASAVAVGADEVAAAFAELVDVTVVRTGSRGLLWAEPLVELEVDGVRLGFANVEPGEVGSVLDGSLERLEGRFLGVVDDHPWLAPQRRVTAARVGVVDPAYRVWEQPALDFQEDVGIHDVEG